MAQLKDTIVYGGLEVENSIVLDDSIEFKRTYVGADGIEVTHQHPIININNVSESGMGVAIESQGTRPLFLGSGEQATVLADTLDYTDISDVQDLFFVSGHSSRFYSGTNHEYGNGLKEAMRLNTAGNLVFFREPDGSGNEHYYIQFKDGLGGGDYYGHIDVVPPADGDTLNTRAIRLTSHSKNVPEGWELKALNTLELGVNDNGARTVYVSAPAAWREAIGSNDAANITTGTLAIARGGTGATSASAARTSLGAAKAVDSGSAVTTNTYFNYYLKNGLCTLYANSSAKSIGTNGTQICTLPSACRPKLDVQGALSTTANNCGQFRITTGGVVTCWNFGGSNTYWTFTVTYPVA